MAINAAIEAMRAAHATELDRIAGIRCIYNGSLPSLEQHRHRWDSLQRSQHVSLGWFRGLAMVPFDDSRREILGRIFQGLNGYQPESYTGRVTLFRATVRPLLHSLSPDLGWSPVAKEVIVHRIPGDHNTILESAGMNRISELIAQSQNPW
ncbi:MAG: hypothetical protein WCI02_14605 [Planctomycetota bacterium]|jgi:hypothetical protein